MRELLSIVLIATLIVSVIPLVALGVAEADTFSGHSVGEMQYPIDGYVVNGYYFGQYLPTDEYPERYHLGEDICKPAGTQVVAMADGVVKVATGNHASYGGLIIIEHTLADGKTYCSLYGHLKHSETLVEPGNTVSKGQPIGELSGDPADYGGPDSVPHLHFGIRCGAFPGEHALDEDTTSGWYWGGYGKKDPRTVSDWWIKPSAFVSPPPAITGVEPAQPWQSDSRERFSILGSGFVREPSSIVTVKAPDPDNRTWPIPRENNPFIHVSEDGTRIDIDVQFHMKGRWTVWVTNPDGQESNVYDFDVRSRPTAAIDLELLKKIDEYVDKDEYWRDDWDDGEFNREQYKAWIATLAWSEGRAGGYGAHSQGPGDDIFGHKHEDVGVAFTFSTGLGPFQIDRIHRPGWTPAIDARTMPTIDKLNDAKALQIVLQYHYNDFSGSHTLGDFNALTHEWYGARSAHWPGLWEAVTGTSWDNHKDADILLDWAGIREKLATNAESDVYRYENNVRKVGYVEWNITEVIERSGEEDREVRFVGCQPTWLITARGIHPTALFTYYYTLNRAEGLEVWVWNNGGDPDNEFRHVFFRDFHRNKDQDPPVNDPVYPEDRNGTVAGRTLSSPALDPSLICAPDLDVALIIDSSGSMSWNDPAGLRKEGAKIFVGSARNDDQIAVIDFARDIEVRFHLGPRTDDPSPILDAIDLIGASGATNIRDAVLEAHEELSSGPPGSNKVAILLTDGVHNVGHYAEAHQVFIDEGWPVYTLGLFQRERDRQQGEPLMERIAAETGGKYWLLEDPNQLKLVYHEIAREILGGESRLDATTPLLPGETRHLAANIPPAQSQASFLTDWAGSTVDTTLTAPDGTVISPDALDPGVYHAKGLTYELYRITDPKPGEWTITLFGADLPPPGQDVEVQVFSIPLVVGQTWVETTTSTGMAAFTPSHGIIEDLEALPELPPGVPDGVTFPHGMFSFRVTGLDLGQTVTIEMELPDPVPEDFVWWKYHEGEWYDLPIDIVAPNIITITLTDGEYPGDLDGVADGTIIDPGGPGNPRSLPSAPPGAGAEYPVWSILLAGLMAGASLLLLRRRRAQI